MRAVDTNVLLRYFSDDDPIQSPLARQVLAEGGAFVARTVVLEFEWVARSAYKRQPAAIVAALRFLMARADIVVENEPMIELACDRYLAGFDFADALHHAAASQCTEFVSFDRDSLVKRAAKQSLYPPVVVPS